MSLKPVAIKAGKTAVKANTTTFSDQAWMTLYTELQAYQQEYGHCRVPIEYEKSRKLCSWMDRQRTLYKNKSLKPSRINALEYLGFKWTIRATELEAKWEANLNKLKDFKAANGHCMVPLRWRQDPSLAAWVDTQRVKARRGTLDAYRKKQLNFIGFAWNPGRNYWNPKAKAANAALGESGLSFAGNGNLKDDQVDAEFEDEDFHTNASHDNDLMRSITEKGRDGTGLVEVNADATNLTHAREHQVSAITSNSETTDGPTIFTQPRDLAWWTNVCHLEAYKKQHGHCHVPDGYTEQALGKWVEMQRVNYKRGDLNQEQIDTLQSLDFEWNAQSRQYHSVWSKNFVKLKAFRCIHGHCCVPRRWPDDLVLGRWVYKQRENARAGIIKIEHKAKLDAINFVWSPKCGGHTTATMNGLPPRLDASVNGMEEELAVKESSAVAGIANNEAHAGSMEGIEASNRTNCQIDLDTTACEALVETEQNNGAFDAVEFERSRAKRYKEKAKSYRLQRDEYAHRNAQLIMDIETQRNDYEQHVAQLTAKSLRQRNVYAQHMAELAMSCRKEREVNASRVAELMKQVSSLQEQLQPL